MEPEQQKPAADTDVGIDLSKATIRSCSLYGGILEITLTSDMRLEFNPKQLGVKRYLHVVEYGPRGHAPDDFVDRIEQLLREGYLGVPKLVEPGR